MITRTTALRVLFLFIAFLSYPRLSHATEPSWDQSCNSHCEGDTIVHECYFWDGSSGNEWDASSVCAWFECLYSVQCTTDTQLPYPNYEALCHSWANGQVEWVTFPSCGGYDGTVEGEMYCSYPDLQSCPE